MKKLIALLLCILIATCVFTACKKDQAEEETTADTTEMTEPADNDEGGESEEPEEIPMDPADPYINDALFPSLD